MKIFISKSIVFALTITFITIGFYFLNLLAINAGLKGETRLMSSGIRVFIIFLCLILFSPFNSRPSFSINILFFAFFLIYILRILIDFLSLRYFYISYSDLILYFISVCVIPFVAISKIDLRKIRLDSFYKIFLFGSFLFSLLCTVYYSKFIGQVTRLTTTTAGEDVISPLITSYISVLIIGTITTHSLYNKTSKKIKIFSYLTLTLSLIPFFLGASRGSIFALFFPFIIILFSSNSLKYFFHSIVYIITTIILLVFLDDYMNSGLLDRFTNITYAIESGSSSAKRIDLWKQSFIQFLDHPLFGDKLNTEQFNHYPHNVFLEILQSTGIIGFIPFFSLILIGISYSIKIIKYFPQYSWLTVFFLQALMRYMFSGAIYNASLFWPGLGLVFCTYVYIKKINPHHFTKMNFQ